MTWFKVDDSFHSHPKALAAGPAALGLWVVAGSWSGANLTDGFVPDYVLPRLADGARELAETLVTCGLWRRARGGYRFHDWDVYQPSKEEVLKERQKWADKKARQRAAKQAKARSGGSVSPGDTPGDSPATFPQPAECPPGDDVFPPPLENGERGVEKPQKKRTKEHPPSSEGGMSPGDTPGDSPGEYSGESRSSRSRTRTSSYEEVFTSEADAPDAPPRLDVERLCAHLADRIEANGSKRPTITKKWRDAARLLLDKDGRTEDQVRAAIDWCQADEFWRGVVMSMPKLRDKYDQLRLQARRSAVGAPGHRPPPRSTTDERIAAAQALKHQPPDPGADVGGRPHPLVMIMGELDQ